MQLERVRVAEVEPVQPFCDDDRVPPVGREVHVVRVVDRERASGPAGARVYRRERVTHVVRHVQRLQVPRRDDVLRERAHGEMLDDPECALVDHVDRVAVAVRNVDVRAGAPRLCAEVPDPVGGVDVGDRYCLRLPGRLRRRDELRQTGDRPGFVATSGDEDSSRVGNRGEIRSGRVELADDANAARCRIDRDDAVGRGSDGATTSSDHEGERADARSRRVGRRRRQPAEPEDPACGGDVLVDGIARCTRLERAARDDEPVADGRDRGIPERVRQAGDDPRASTGAPRDDRVQPTAARVSADDVRRPADGRGGLVRAARRQMPDRLRSPGVRVDHQDRVELRGGGSPAEQVHVAADAHGRGIVQRRRNATDPRRPRTRRGHDRVSRYVRGSQTAHEHGTSGVRRRSGILHGSVERACCDGNQAPHQRVRAHLLHRIRLCAGRDLLRLLVRTAACRER